MKLNKRKRKVSVEQEFTVLAKDSLSVEIIKQIAGQHKIELFRKGHAKNRLYFYCKEDEKIRFIGEISGLCFCESSITPPNDILRFYRKKLLRTAIDKFARKSAQAALKVLSGNNAKKETSVSLVPADNKPLETVSSEKTVVDIKQNKKSSMIKSAINGAKNYLRCMRDFIGPESSVAFDQR